MNCACIGEGVHDKPGVRPDGQQCEQKTSIAMLMQSQAASITVSKPSNGSAELRIVVRATGESRVSAAYNASTVHRSAAAVGGVQPNSSRTWVAQCGAGNDGAAVWVGPHERQERRVERRLERRVDYADGHDELRTGRRVDCEVHRSAAANDDLRQCGADVEQPPAWSSLGRRRNAAVEVVAAGVARICPSFHVTCATA